MAKLGVNIDHIATTRQARYRQATERDFAEPNPVTFAQIAEKAGAANITVHLREDRRHMQEYDVRRLRQVLRRPLNLEMAVTPWMQRFATRLKPAEVCLVPENRQEVTTEGGLDLLGQENRIRACVHALQKAGIAVSLFIDPDESQIETAVRIGVPIVELHTGAFSLATTKAKLASELNRQARAAALGHHLGLQVNAGHGLNYKNVTTYLRAVPQVHTLNIGHAIVSHALAVGFATAVREMVQLCRVTRK
jgi:pyridoxine 5-phosphate synthase